MDNKYYFLLALVFSFLFILAGIFILIYYVYFLKTSPYAPFTTSVILFFAAGYSVYILSKKRSKN
jgi:hypothetical protein